MHVGTVEQDSTMYFKHRLRHGQFTAHSLMHMDIDVLMLALGLQLQSIYE